MTSTNTPEVGQQYRDANSGHVVEITNVTKTFVYATNTTDGFQGAYRADDFADDVADGTLTLAIAVTPIAAKAESVKLSKAMAAALRYFANPNPDTAYNAKAAKAKGATDAALRSRGLIEATDAHPYQQPTAAGWDWYVADRDNVTRWIEHAKTATLTDSFEPVTEAQAVDAVRKALTKLTVRGLKPGLAAAELRALNARFPELTEVKAEQPAPQVGDRVRITKGRHAGRVGTVDRLSELTPGWVGVQIVGVARRTWTPPQSTESLRQRFYVQTEVCAGGRDDAWQAAGPTESVVADSVARLATLVEYDAEGNDAADGTMWRVLMMLPGSADGVVIAEGVVRRPIVEGFLTVTGDMDVHWGNDGHTACGLDDAAAAGPNTKAPTCGMCKSVWLLTR